MGDRGLHRVMQDTWWIVAIVQRLICSLGSRSRSAWVLLKRKGKALSSRTTRALSWGPIVAELAKGPAGDR
jgi:hypothetical protein